MAHLLLTTALATQLRGYALAGPGPFGIPDGLVTIKCARPGMRRCGVTHPAIETYPLDRWTEDELLVFEADPNFQVLFEGESAVAPGATTADAIQDNGAGPPIPDLGAKPDGTGPASLPIGAPGTTPAGDVAVVANERVAAISSALPDLVAGTDFTGEGQPRIEALERKLGFKPTRAEVDAAIGLKPAVVA